MINSLLYVSQTNLRLREEAGAIDEILSVARSRNAALDVTGTLVFTQARFAQILEGGNAAITELMESIKSDPRHREVNVVLVEELSHRRFAGWAMAYQGPSIFVDRHVKPLLQQNIAPSEKAVKGQRLIALMVELASR
ncbi:BLUF domain-containing protein [Altericroceibacterium xinjiangense]|uniref:BLUF domain-containing protein n=1 Tax=Altericroceibacterium xinjiangense TaxID=762261 RepID=UPI000F7DF699|nr:BLUF domain-containing protein [Altericroceibacterium xinjiangense]